MVWHAWLPLLVRMADTAWRILPVSPQATTRLKRQAQDNAVRVWPVGSFIPVLRTVVSSRRWKRDSAGPTVVSWLNYRLRHHFIWTGEGISPSTSGGSVWKLSGCCPWSISKRAWRLRKHSDGCEKRVSLMSSNTPHSPIPMIWGAEEHSCEVTFIHNRDPPKLHFNGQCQYLDSRMTQWLIKAN